MNGEIAAILNLVKTADLVVEAKHTTLWCVQQLPALCDSFSQSYESRYADEIVRLERAIQGHLAATPVAAEVLKSLELLHQRLGLPAVVPLPVPAAPKTRRRKVA